MIRNRYTPPPVASSVCRFCAWFTFAATFSVGMILGGAIIAAFVI